MKKSDIAIYISAILTLVLTTAIVFSTQRVSYENKLDDLLRDSSAETNHLAMATDPNTGSDLQPPLFRNRLPDESSDIKKAEPIAPRKFDAEHSIKSDAQDEKAVTKPIASAKKNAIFDDEAQDKIIGKPFNVNDKPDKKIQNDPIVLKQTEPQKIQIPENKPETVDAKTIQENNPAASPKPEAKVSSPLAKPETVKTEAKPVKNEKVSSPVTKPEAIAAKNDKAGSAVVQPETTSVKSETTTIGTDITAKSDRVHIVQSGDMLRTIAARYGTTTI
ncbi:MAG: hypothetical protein LBC99_10435, partial [Spirochaetota bacterium]|nr:hypothetical protein [Spirochaetota bacterium]